MRSMLLLAVAGCTVGAAPGAATPRVGSMPSTVLDHQDPGADTTHNPERSRSESSSGHPLAWLRMLPIFWCNAGSTGEGDAGGLIVVAAAVVALRRRRTREI